MKIVAIVGTRVRGQDNNLTVAQKVEDALKCLNPKEDIILSGGAASGADYWAKKLARKYGFQYLEAPADWYPESNSHKLDKAAGYRRNKTIARVCTHLVAVWDGKSFGTANTLSYAVQFGKPIWIVNL